MSTGDESNDELDEELEDRTLENGNGDEPSGLDEEGLSPEERAALEAAAEDLEDESPEPEEAPAAAPQIARRRLDEDGVKVVRRLSKFGHETYFVGGCVRDLLLGIEPKDFDLATSALPEETRKIFSNCRLIGRRFRLAHIYFRGGKVIETATFRANPREVAGEDESAEGTEDLYLEQDNVYGTAEQDARRRDFTVNGLFYDPKTGKVIDYVNGLADLDARLIRTIGEADVRMQEDPVRILRAVRFAAKLDFDIEPETYAALKARVGDISRCAPPRVVEEIMKLLRVGAARPAFVLLHEIGALPVLLPPVGKHLDTCSDVEQARFFALLDATDEWTRHNGGPPDDAVLLGALLTALFPPDELPTARSGELDDLLRGLLGESRLPRRRVERLRLILGAQRVFGGARKRRFSVGRFVRQAYITDAMILFDIRVRAFGADSEHYSKWVERVASEGGGPTEASQGGRKRRRRRRGGRGRKS